MYIFHVRRTDLLATLYTWLDLIVAKPYEIAYYPFFTDG